jgi:hypothetical protein
MASVTLVLRQPIGDRVVVTLIGNEGVLADFFGQWLIEQRCRHTNPFVSLKLWPPEQGGAANPTKPSLHFFR